MGRIIRELNSPYMYGELISLLFTTCCYGVPGDAYRYLQN
jgi:hypothetical protein